MDADQALIQQTIEKLDRLPRLHPGAVKLLGVDSEDVKLEEFAHLVQSDPVLCSEILHLANSPLFGARAPVQSVRHALVMLGVDRVKAIAVTVAMQAYSATGLAGDLLRNCWRHSLATAVIAEAIADRSAKERAYTAALTHDIGRFALMKMDASRCIPLMQAEHATTSSVLWAETAAFGIHHGQAGAWICRTWQLPSSICVSAQYHHTLHGKSPELEVTCLACELASLLNFTSVRVRKRTAQDAVLARLPRRAQAQGTSTFLTGLRERIRQALAAVDTQAPADGR